MKICFVKQEVYQDLYICPNGSDPGDLLASSAMRVGPYGLFSRLGADFRIVKEEKDRETQIYRKSLPHLANDMWLMRDHTLRELPGMGFAEPGTENTNGMYAISAADVDWGTYDVVISVNVSIPRRIVAQYPKTLFCYMIGEANVLLDKPRFGYDCVLNQEGLGREVSEKNWVIDFPYTFLGKSCLENFAEKRFGAVDREGIYPEINMCPERPVESIPAPLAKLSQSFPVRLHRQNISENIRALQRSRFFVKLGGRVTRGNGFVEAISAGCLAVFRKEEVIHANLFLDALSFADESGLEKVIGDLSQDADRVEEMQNQQRELVEKYYFELPLKSIERCLGWKREGKSRTRSFFSFFR